MSLFGGRHRDGESEAQPASADSGASTLGGLRSEPSRVVDGSRLWGADGSVVAGDTMANIGKSIAIKGDLSGDEDLVIEGKVEGKIELPSNQLTVGPDGHVSAEVHAKSVVIVGKLTGNVNATERVEIQATGTVDGDVRAPRLAVEEGAVLNGSVETGPQQSTPASLHRPAPAAASEKSAFS